MRILRENQEEEPLADDRVNPRAVGIPCLVASLVVRDDLGDLRQRLAAHQFRADERELGVNVPSMDFIPQLVRRPRHILANDGLDAQVQRVRADLNLRSHACHVTKSQVDCRRQALVSPDVVDAIVYHMSIVVSSVIPSLSRNPPNLPHFDTTILQSSHIQRIA